MVSRARFQLQLGDGNEEPVTKAPEPIAARSDCHRRRLTAGRYRHRDPTLASDYILRLGSRPLGTGECKI